jgi:hypothetical protein
MAGPIVVQVKIEGLAELAEALEKQPREVAKKIIRTGLKRAAGLWREEMIRTVKRGWHVFAEKHSKGGRTREYGFLAQHIGLRASLSSDELAGIVTVGPVKKGFWSLFMEFQSPGAHNPAPPFIRPAFEAKKFAVRDKFIDTVREQLAKIKAKQAKKAT